MLTENMVRGLDQDETNFLDEVSRQQCLLEKKTRDEEMQELLEYRISFDIIRRGFFCCCFVGWEYILFNICVGLKKQKWMWLSCVQISSKKTKIITFTETTSQFKWGLALPGSLWAEPLRCLLSSQQQQKFKQRSQKLDQPAICPFVLTYFSHTFEQLG